MKLTLLIKINIHKNSNRIMKKTKQNQSKVLPKCLLCLFIFLITAISGFSQNAGISATGTTPPNTVAGLDVDFTIKGFLIPRVVLVGINSPSPFLAKDAGRISYNRITKL